MEIKQCELTVFYGAKKQPSLKEYECFFIDTQAQGNKGEQSGTKSTQPIPRLTETPKARTISPHIDK